MDEEFFLSSEEFFRRNLPSGVTFDDVTLATRYSEILPGNVNLETSLSESIRLSIPIVSSDMDTVTESKMAIAMAPRVYQDQFVYIAVRAGRRCDTDAATGRVTAQMRTVDL